MVENVAGASGGIGAVRVKQSEPDGYTLLQAASPHTTNAAVKPAGQRRLAARLRADRDDGQQCVHALCQQALRHSRFRRTCGARQGQAERTAGRQCRDRFDASSGRRNSEIGSRHRTHTCALSRGGAGHSRSHRRPHRRDVSDHSKALDRRRSGDRSCRHIRRGHGSTCLASNPWWLWVCATLSCRVGTA